MNTSNFLSKENLNMLWDVISDEEIFKFLSREVQTKIANLFSENIKGFYNTEKAKQSNLIDLNKKYILLILNHIKKTYSYQPNKIKIYDEQLATELITAEEIQIERKSQFEKDLQHRQQEFENSMMVKVPPVPEFIDKYEDRPIGEIDKVIKEMTAKRNYDVEQINLTHNLDINKSNNWLKSQETSLKTEKLTPQNIQDESYSRFKFLKNNNDVDNNILSTKKNVTWGENNEIDDVEENIFNKLKKISKPEESYDEQRMTTLENQIKSINNKIDLILDLIKQNK